MRNPSTSVLTSLTRSTLKAATLVFLCGGCSAGTDFTQCNTTADCLDHGLENTICSTGKYCIEATSKGFPNCPTIVGGPLTRNSTLVALLSKLSGQSASLGISAQGAASLALEELQSYGAGAAVREGRRPGDLRILVCDDGKDSGESIQIARHVVGTLGIQAVMGPVFSQSAVDVAYNITIPAETLMLNPFAVTPSLTGLKDNDLVWRTSSSNASEPWGMAALTSQVEAYLRSSNAVAVGEQIRVATIARPDLYGRGIVDVYNKNLRINGGSSTPKQSELHAFELNKTDSGYSLSATDLAAIRGFSPHVVVLAGTGEMVPEALEKLETAGLAIAPYYIGSEGLRLNDLIGYVANRNNKSVYKRIQVFAPNIRDDYYPALAQRWSARYREVLPDLYGVANTYDATYLLAYSLALLGPSPVTGPAWAAALHKMSSGGTKISAGPDSIVRAYQALATNGRIDYDGVVGPLDFDANGEAPAVFDLLCVSQDGSAWNFKRTGVTLKDSSSGPMLTSASYQPCK